MDGATIDVETKSRERKNRKGKKTTSKVQDDFLKIQDGKGKEKGSMKSS